MLVEQNSTHRTQGRADSVAGWSSVKYMNKKYIRVWVTSLSVQSLNMSFESIMNRKAFILSLSYVERYHDSSAFGETTSLKGLERRCEETTFHLPWFHTTSHAKAGERKKGRTSQSAWSAQIYHLRTWVKPLYINQHVSTCIRSNRMPVAVCERLCVPTLRRFRLCDECSVNHCSTM